MPNKSVAIVGVLDISSSTNVWMAAAFQRLGWNVIPINYRHLQKNVDDFAKHYEFVISRFKPNLTILSKINGVDPSIISLVKDTTTWYWFMDNINVADSINAVKYAEITDYASATSSEVVEQFKKVNQNSYHIIEGYEPNIFYKVDADKDIDVLFFGNATARRIEFLSKLHKKITVFGLGWPSEFNANELVYLEDLRDIIARSKIILNLVHSNIFSDRVVTSMACGGFILSEYCRDLFTFFNNKEHLVWFYDIDECNKLIDYYLNNEDEREKIANNGMKKVINFYAWDNVIQHIIHILGA